MTVSSDFTRKAFAGQCCRVERGCSGNHHAVQRNFLAGFHDNDAAGRNRIGSDLRETAVAVIQVRVVRADVHQ